MHKKTLYQLVRPLGLKLRLTVVRWERGLLDTSLSHDGSHRSLNLHSSNKVKDLQTPLEFEMSDCRGVAITYIQLWLSLR